VGGGISGGFPGTGGGKPLQIHHFLTNKNKNFTPRFEDITNKYGLKLNDDWNKAKMPHQGRHPNDYHRYMLNEIRKIDNIAKGDKNMFLDLFSKIKTKIIKNPDMLYKKYWN